MGPGTKRGRITLPASTSRTAPDSNTPSSLVNGAVGASASKNAIAAAKIAAASSQSLRGLLSGTSEQKQRHAHGYPHGGDHITFAREDARQNCVYDGRGQLEVVLP